MRHVPLSAVALVCFLTVPSHAEPKPQTFPDLAKTNGRTPPANHQYPICPRNEPAKTHISAIDVSKQIDANFVDQAVARDVQVIFRYYDWPSVPDEPVDKRKIQAKAANKCFRDRTEFNKQFDFPWKSGETIVGKTLTTGERDLILSRKLAIGTVFQHCNNQIETFKDSKRAAFDAQRALDLAKELGQPPGTAIFFGVDLEVNRSQLKPVKNYVDVVKKKLEAGGYILGIYGNGLICSTFAATVKYCWLSQSTGHTGSKDYAEKRKWDILQCLPRDPFPTGGPDFDINVFNDGKPQIPFWSADTAK